MKAVVAAFNQEDALVGAFSVITNLWMELFGALPITAHLVDLALAAVLRGDLVLAAAPDVAAEGELLLGELVLAQQVVELVHGQVDDVGAGDGQPHAGGLQLVPLNGNYTYTEREYVSRIMKLVHTFDFSAI